MSDVVAVHQLIPSLHVHDASGAHTLHARDALRAAGFESELFVEHVDAPLAAEAHHFGELDRFVRPGRTALLYQLAVGSAMVDRLLARPEPLLVNYHNLTPAAFFWQWAPDWLDAVEMGRAQLAALAPRTRRAIAVSEFNRRDLVAAGYRDTVVVPPFVDTEGFAAGRGPVGSADPVTAGRGARWLFVGKVLPHKAQHDVIMAFACYRRAYDPDAHLLLVGGTPARSYADALTGFVEAAGLTGAVTLAGAVSHGELATAYRTADVFVCLSDHEGFCFPLLEAMHHELPVVAYDAGAVGETAGTAGVVLREKAPAIVAAAVHRVLTDPLLRRRLAAAGRARLGELSLVKTADAFVHAVRGALPGAGAARAGERPSGERPSGERPSVGRPSGERPVGGPEEAG